MTHPTPRLKHFLLSLILASTCSILWSQDTLLKARYVFLPYDLIPDEKVTHTPEDLVYWKLKVREVKQVYAAAFEINYSAKDSLNTYKSLKKIQKISLAIFRTRHYLHVWEQKSFVLTRKKHLPEKTIL